MSTNSRPVPHAVPPPRRAAGLWAGLALLLALAALAAGAWSLLQLRLTSDRAVAQDLELKQAQARTEAASREAAVLRTQVRELADRAAGMERRLDETHAALDQVTQTSANADFALAEIEYLLILAEERLALMQDNGTAQAALRMAERRLAGLDVPGLDAVRGQIGADLLRLAQAPEIDYGQWVEELGALAVAAETLPLRAAAQAEAPTVDAVAPAQGWRGLLQSIWRELRSMVVISRNSAGVSPLPSDRHSMVQSLLLRIETTRLALLRRDGRALHDAAASTTDWLQRWFNGADPRVRAALDRLQVLSELDLAAPPPDITSSLETLRALIRERAAPMTPPPATQP